jgi:hypothetical protein
MAFPIVWSIAVATAGLFVRIWIRARRARAVAKAAQLLSEERRSPEPRSKATEIRSLALSRMSNSFAASPRIVGLPRAGVQGTR